MPRTWYGRRKPQISIAQVHALSASATTIDLAAPPSHVLWGGAGWQLEAWAHYDSCPELHRAATDMGEAFSRAKLMAVDVDPTTGDLGEDPTDDPTTGALVGRMFGGRDGQAEAQRQIGVHLTVVGECWVLLTDDLPDVDEQPWQVISVSEVQKAGNTVMIQNLDGTRRNLQPTELLFRVWQPHPKIRWEADSPTRALLPTLRELAGFSAQVMASIRSRLASAGVWLLPQSATLPPQKDEAGNDLPGGADAWLSLLAKAMMTAIANPDDPSALIPIIAMIPDGILNQIKDPFQFTKDVISDVQPMREAAVKRLAIGFDAPPERLLGVGDMNHWSAWQTDEAFVKGSLSSLLSIPASAFTMKYLRPALRIAGRDPRTFAVAFDVSDMMPEVQEKNAQGAYDSGELSARAYLEALHFDPIRDAPTQQERADRILTEILKKANPEILQAESPAIKRLYPGLVTIAPTPDVPATPPPGPSVGTPPAITPPSTTDTQSPPAAPAAPPDNAPAVPPAA